MARRAACSDDCVRWDRSSLSKGSRADDGVSVWRGLRTASERTGGARPKNRQTFGLLSGRRGSGFRSPKIRGGEG